MGFRDRYARARQSGYVNANMPISTIMLSNGFNDFRHLEKNTLKSGAKQPI